MELSECKIGLRVKDISDYPSRYGSIVETANSIITGKVRVEFDDNSFVDIDVDGLEISDPEIEKDYQMIKDQIEIAANALNLATIIAKKNGSSLSELGEEVDVGTLYSAISKAGWSSSSMRC